MTRIGGAALNGLAEGMGRRGGQLGAFLRTLPESRQPAAAQATRLLTDAAAVAADVKRVSDERPQRHLAPPLHVRRPRLEPGHVRLGQAKLGIQNTRVQKQDNAARSFRFELGRSELHPTFAFEDTP